MPILKNNKQEDLVHNKYLNLPDLQFYHWCHQQYSLNRGVFNTIDQWFYDYGIKEVLFRRIYILSFLSFAKEKGLKSDQTKFIRFGNGGLIEQLSQFISEKSIKT